MLAVLFLLLASCFITPAAAGETANEPTITLEWADIPATATQNGRTVEWTPTSTDAGVFEMTLTITVPRAYPANTFRAEIPQRIRDAMSGLSQYTVEVPLSSKFAYQQSSDQEYLVFTNTQEIDGPYTFNAKLRCLISPYSRQGEDYLIVAKLYESLAGGGQTEYTAPALVLRTISPTVFDSSTKKYVQTYGDIGRRAVLRSWPAAWGEETPPGKFPTETEYFYVWWDFDIKFVGYDYVYTTLNETQTMGEIVGYKRSTNADTAPTRITQKALNDILTSMKGPSTYVAHYDAVLVRYPSSLLVTQQDGSKTYTVRNTATATLYGSNKAFIEEKPLSSTYTVRFLDYEYPGDSVAASKMSISTNDYGIGLLSTLEVGEKLPRVYFGRPTINFSFYNDTTFYGWDLTQQAGEMGILPYGAAITDNTFTLRGDKGEILPLQSGDYAITNVAVTVRESIVDDDPTKPTQTTKDVSRTPDDYAIYPVIVEYQTQKDGPWVEATSTDYTNYTMPTGVIGVRAKTTSTAIGLHFRLSITGMDVYSTKHIRDFIKDKEHVTLVDRSLFQPLNPDGTPFSAPLAREAEIPQLTRVPKVTYTYKSGSTSYDQTTDLYKISFGLQDDFGYNTYYAGADVRQKLLDQGLIVQREKGVFYDLLPPGVAFDAGSLSVSSGMNPIPFTTSLITNWNGTGRDLLTINWETTPSSAQYVLARFDGYVSRTYYYDYGATARNYVAHVHLDGATKAANDTSPGIITSFPQDIQDAFAAAFAKDNVATKDKVGYSAVDVKMLKPLESSQSIANKKVKTPGDLTHTGEAFVLQAEGYQYQISRATSVDDVFTNNIFVDNIEQNTDAAGWKGVLSSVDVTQPLGKGVDVKVYYAAAYQALPENTPPDFLAPGSPWIPLTKSTDLTQVKAIAFDLSKDTKGEEYHLLPGQSLVVNLNMKAPENVLPYFQISDDPITRNQSTFYYTNQTLNGVENYGGPSGETQVHLRPLPLSFVKEAEPAGGTPDAPVLAAPGDAIVYALTAQNMGEFDQAAHTIVLEENLPAALTLDTSENKGLQFAFAGDAFTPLDSGNQRISWTNTGNSYLFTIDRLAKGEQVRIRLHTLVNEEQGAEDAITNTAALLSAQGTPMNLTGTTYHQRQRLLLNFAGKKELRNSGLSAGQFTFTLEEGAAEGGAALPLLATTTNQADGVFAFASYGVFAPGEYWYTIRETKGSTPGITYDSTAYTIRISVQEEGNTLQSTGAVVYKDGVEHQGEMVFENTYTKPDPPVTPASFTIQAKKVLKGQSLQAGAFTFELFDGAGYRIDTAANDAQGNIVFGKRTAGNPGTYLYTISEVQGNQSNITYDDTKWQVRATVSARGSGMTTNLVYLKDGTPYDSAAFVNTYHLPQTGDSTPAAIAVLLGFCILAFLAQYKLKPKETR